jgi:hypothetical protein
MKALTAGFSLIAVAWAMLSAEPALAASTAFCIVKELTCPSTSVYTGNFQELSKAVLIDLGSAGHITCHHSTLAGSVGKLDDPLVISISTYSLKDCLSGTVTVIDETGLNRRTKVSPTEATGTNRGFRLLVETGFVHCVFDSTQARTIILEGGQESVNEGELEELEGGFFCPENPKLTATYKITTPSTFYMSR